MGSGWGIAGGIDSVAAFFRNNLCDPGREPDGDAYHKRNRPDGNRERSRDEGWTGGIPAGTDGGGNGDPAAAATADHRRLLR